MTRTLLVLLAGLSVFSQACTYTENSWIGKYELLGTKPVTDGSICARITIRNEALQQKEKIHGFDGPIDYINSQTPVALTSITPTYAVHSGAEDKTFTKGNSLSEGTLTDLGPIAPGETITFDLPYPAGYTAPAGQTDYFDLSLTAHVRHRTAGDSIDELGFDNGRMHFAGDSVTPEGLCGFEYDYVISWTDTQANDTQLDPVKTNY